MNLLDLMQPTADEPAAATQNGRLLAYLRRGHTVCPVTAWTVLGIYRLGSRIHDLRKMGHPVIGERKDVTNRFGEKVNVCHYHLEKQA